MGSIDITQRNTRLRTKARMPQRRMIAIWEYSCRAEFLRLLDTLRIRNLHDYTTDHVNDLLLPMGISTLSTNRQLPIPVTALE